MRNLLNTAWHYLAEKFEKDVEISNLELKRINELTESVETELKEWVSGSYELISLGQNCNSSWYIKDCGLKRASYPFDWIFTSADIIEHMLEDDFDKLTDRELVIPKGFRAGHKFYHDFYFGHRNPVSSESGMDYFKRCVARWHKMIQEQRPVLFVYIVLNESEKRPDYVNGFIHEFRHPGVQKPKHFERMIEMMQGLNPNTKFLFIEQYTERPFDLSITHKNEPMLWLKYDALGSNTGVKYLNEVDDRVMKRLYRSLA